MQTFVKNLIDQQPQISKALQDAITTVIGSHRDMVLFDFNQESVDTTFVDESLIDDAPVVAPPMPLPPVVEGKKLNKMNSTHRCIRSLSISTAHQRL